jgi:hypothetical protein
MYLASPDTGKPKQPQADEEAKQEISLDSLK